MSGMAIFRQLILDNQAAGKLLALWLFTYDFALEWSGVRDGEGIGCLRSSCKRDFPCNEWPSLAGLLYSRYNAMALYRSRSSFLAHRHSDNSSPVVALIVEGQDQSFLYDGCQSIVRWSPDANPVSSHGLNTLQAGLNGQ
jgi:hypothetical protein